MCNVFVLPLLCYAIIEKFNYINDKEENILLLIIKIIIVII